MTAKAKPLDQTQQSEAMPLSFVVLPPETYRALNAEALRLGLPLSRLLDEALKDYLQKLRAQR